MAAVAAPTFVTHVSGQRFSIRIRSHEIFVDQTVAGGGNDSAPGPLELLGASLGSCIAYYVYQFLHSRGLPAEDLSVAVVPHRSDNPGRIDRFAVMVSLPGRIPAKYMPLLERIVHQCPAHNTLAQGALIGVSFTSTAEVLIAS